jgi:hypothetical protein
MAGRECYHCKQWVGEGEANDCWTTTEAALTKDLSEDLKDAWSGCAKPPWRLASSGFMRPITDHVLAQGLLLL